MKCKDCGYETDSEKIFYVHADNCMSNQQENRLLDQEESDPTKMDWQQLKKYAVEKGIEIKGKKKEDILAELSALGGNKDDNNASKGKNNPAVG